jgi:hypothetical protein
MSREYRCPHCNKSSTFTTRASDAMSTCDHCLRVVAYERLLVETWHEHIQGSRALADALTRDDYWAAVFREKEEREYDAEKRVRLTKAMDEDEAQARYDEKDWRDSRE